MNKTNCIIVDDEPIAAKVIESYVEKLESFKISGIFNNAIQAFEYLQMHHVDLVFLDIQMPKVTGLEFLRSLKNPPKVILVTAYREFAYEGFELDVIDYLLKPVSFERFLKAIDKFNEINKAATIQKDSPAPQPSLEEECIWVRADRKNVKLALSEITYIEGLKDYVKIYTEKDRVICKMPLKKIESMLPGDRFLRVHRSFVIPLSKITAFNNEGIEIGTVQIPIGKMYKTEVIPYLEKFI